MFRATIFSFVLILAVGPGASLLCRMPCEPSAAAAGACHLETRAASVGTDDSCDHTALRPAAVLQQHVWRTDSSHDGGPATSEPRYLLADSTIHVRSRPERGREWSPATRSLATVLRV